MIAHMRINGKTKKKAILIIAVRTIDTHEEIETPIVLTKAIKIIILKIDTGHMEKTTAMKGTRFLNLLHH